MHHFGHDHDVIGGLYDRVVIVVKVVREHWWPRIRPERNDTPLSERPVFGIIILTKLPSELRGFSHPLS